MDTRCERICTYDMIALQMVRANFKGAMVMVIGENILRTRKNKGLTQTELAEMVGVSFQAVSSC